MARLAKTKKEMRQIRRFRNYLERQNWSKIKVLVFNKKEKKKIYDWSKKSTKERKHIKQMTKKATSVGF